jgi:hypothetical protein
MHRQGAKLMAEGCMSKAVGLDFSYLPKYIHARYFLVIAVEKMDDRCPFAL